MNLNGKQTVISRMIEGFTFDRGNFKLDHNWTRSIVAGGVSTGLVILATYCVIQMMSPAFGAGMGAQVINFKIAGGTMLVALLSYSLISLFYAIQADTKTALRLQRVDSWLRDGWAVHARSQNTLSLSSCKLSMLRCIEYSHGIEVYLLADSSSVEKPFLIEVALSDDSLAAPGSIHIDADEVAARITHVCDRWTPIAAKVIGIELDTPDPVHPQENDAVYDAPRHGRASSPVQGKRKAKPVSAEVVNAS